MVTQSGGLWGRGQEEEATRVPPEDKVVRFIVEKPTSLPSSTTRLTDPVIGRKQAQDSAALPTSMARK